MSTPAEERTRKVFFFLFALFEVTFIILFRTVSSLPESVYGATATAAEIGHSNLDYIFYVNIITMTFVGYGLLYSVVGGKTTFVNASLVAVVGFQWALLMNEFWERVNTGEWSDNFIITIPQLVRACYTTVAILISVGTVLGNASTVQLIFVTVFEALAYALNRYIIQYQLNTNAIEIAIFVHVFGAFFGLGLSAFFKNANPQKPSNSQSDNLIAIIGTLVLFIFFPSYNAFNAEHAHQSRVVVNTFLATTSSALVTFAFSALGNNGKWSLTELRNGVIVGGITMSSSIAILCGPAASAGTGLVAAILVQFFISKVHNKLFAKLGDTSYTFAVHFLAGTVAAVGSMIAIADAYSQGAFYGSKTTDVYPSGDNAAGNLVAAYFVTIGMGLFQGLFVGAIFGLKAFKN